MSGSQAEPGARADEPTCAGPPRYELLHRERLWQSPWYSLRQDRLRDEAGHAFTYTIVEHPGSVVILPVTREGDVVLIRSYRYPVGEFCLELPAGGMGSDPTPEAAALRELQEEVGGRADRLQYVGWFYPSNGISNEKSHIFLAAGEVLAAVRGLSEQGTTVVAITHLMDEAAEAGRVIVLQEGKIALEGTPRRVLTEVAEMRRLQLDVPQAAELAYLLHQRDPSFPGDLLTVREVVEAIGQRAAVRPDRGEGASP